MINLGVLAHQLLLARLVGQVAADLVAVLLGLEQRDQVDAAPHLFAGKFTGGVVRICLMGVGERVRCPGRSGE